jgi:hypothetical protein
MARARARQKAVSARRPVEINPWIWASASDRAVELFNLNQAFTRTKEFP